MNCTGYEVLHLKDAEPPLALDRPIFEQRRHWYRNPGYDKPLLATVPMSWVPGFHTRTDNQRNPDPGLRLIHLHRMDYGICLARHRARQEREFDQEDVDTGRGYHNRIVEESDFERWFYEDSCFEMMGIHIHPEPIPDDGGDWSENERQWRRTQAEADARGGRLMQAARGLPDRADRLVFPEADSPDEHWQRVAMNQAVDAYIASLQSP